MSSPPPMPIPAFDAAQADRAADACDQVARVLRQADADRARLAATTTEQWEGDARTAFDTRCWELRTVALGLDQQLRTMATGLRMAAAEHRLREVAYQEALIAWQAESTLTTAPP